MTKWCVCIDSIASTPKKQREQDWMTLSVLVFRLCHDWCTIIWMLLLVHTWLLLKLATCYTAFENHKLLHQLHWFDEPWSAQVVVVGNIYSTAMNVNTGIQIFYVNADHKKAGWVLQTGTPNSLYATPSIPDCRGNDTSYHECLHALSRYAPAWSSAIL